MWLDDISSILRRGTVQQLAQQQQQTLAGLSDCFVVFPWDNGIIDLVFHSCAFISEEQDGGEEEEEEEGEIKNTSFFVWGRESRRYFFFFFFF
jgi:hypothetical protein